FSALSFFIVNLSCSMLPASDNVRDILDYIENEYSGAPRFHLDEVDELKNQPLSDYLNRLSKTIAQLYHIKPPRVAVADTVEAQGMIAYDTQTIFISKGMLFAIKNEAELVAILGHEIGHLVLAHGQDKPED